MKACLTPLGALAFLMLAGCESDLPPEPARVPNKIQRGMTGQGTLYQPDRSSDPIIREDTRVGY